MDTKPGLQLFSVKNALEKNFAEALEKIAEIGYRDLQINSSQVTPDGMVFSAGLRAAEVRKHLDRLGLKTPSVHFVPTPDMRLETIVDDMNVLGADTIASAIGFWSSKQEFEEWIPRFNKYGETLKKAGVQLYYHNHFHEFQIFDDKSIYEMMIDELDKDLVKFEFDTYWAVRAGQDPIYWMKKLGKRGDLIHVKDMSADVKTVNLFEKLGYDKIVAMEDFAKFLDPTDFKEIGKGILNIAAYIKAARQYNEAKYLFVEQDFTTLTEMESIEISYASMKQLLAG